MDALDEEEAGVSDEVRLGGERDLSLTFRRWICACDPFFSFARMPNPKERSSVRSASTRTSWRSSSSTQARPVNFVRIFPPRASVSTPGRGLEGHDDRVAPVERLAPDDL